MNTVPISRMFYDRLAFGALLGSMLFCCGCGNKADDSRGKTQSLPVIKVQSTSAVVASNYSVRLEGQADAEIRPQVDGVLQGILVKEGDLVRKGQPLFRIDDSVYREQYSTALAAQHAAEAQAAVAHINTEKLLPLVENKVVSPVQLTTAKAQEQSAKAILEQAAATARAAKINLGYTVIKAPVGGYVGRIPYRQGTLLTKNQTQALTNLSDVTRMYAVFSISETEFERFKSVYAGNTIQEKIANVPSVKLTLSDGSVYNHEGKLESVSGGFDRTTGSIGLRAVFTNSEGLLRSGNSGTATLTTSYSGVLLVPQSATVELQDKVFAFVLQKGNKVKKQVISVSGKSGSNYIVTAGINPGDQIVTASVDKLQDGVLINPIPEGASAPANTSGSSPVKDR
ncbi:MAG: efflux RND transporter periplasmic adaptor subunit [Chlorobiaceae bacterium]|nr:efflux RND transporter periplasmic adaptor subunit [Chlorobiaceae bacterium]